MTKNFEKLKHVLIFRFSSTEGPGYLETYLNERKIQWQLVQVDAGQSIPELSADIAAIALMGGPMSVNDKLSWIEPLLNLLKQAVASDVPVIGHCLGGQLLAKSLGAEITDNACPEIGWGEVNVGPSTAAEEWFGGAQKFEVFHWHYQTFSIPATSASVMSSRFCHPQAFVFNERHIGFQCHIEMTSNMVRQWCEDAEKSLASMNAMTSVQTSNQILQNLDFKIGQLNAIATKVYQRWLSKANL